MIGVIGAMDMEVNGLKEYMQNAEVETIGSIDFYKGTILGVPCVVARSGVGKVNAAICAEIMALVYHPKAIINTGVAGGIGKGIPIDLDLEITLSLKLNGDYAAGGIIALGDFKGFAFPSKGKGGETRLLLEGIEDRFRRKLPQHAVIQSDFPDLQRIRITVLRHRVIPFPHCLPAGQI